MATKTELVDPDSPEGLGGAASPLATGNPPPDGPLSRQRIIEGAIEFIDANGLHDLTMRKLGAHLGVQGMTVYRQVPGREALLDGIVETVIDELYGDPDVHMTATVWQDYLQRLAHGVRRIALAHPEVFPLVATRPPAAPWVRPPLRSLRWMNSFLQTLHECGFSEDASVAAYRSFSSFLLGHLLLEVSGLGADIGPIEQEDPGPPQTGDLSEYPFLSALESKLAEDHSAEEFEDSLDLLIDRLERLLKT